jgi:hypothetical protein
MAGALFHEDIPDRSRTDKVHILALMYKYLDNKSFLLGNHIHGHIEGLVPLHKLLTKVWHSTGISLYTYKSSSQLQSHISSSQCDALDSGSDRRTQT